MGCRVSTSAAEEPPPLVALCRERRELIHSAADRRYALSAAHEAYFRALARVGDALHRFVEEGLIAEPPEPPPDSPVLTLPSSEGKAKGRAKIVETELADGSSPKLSSASGSNSVNSHLHFHSESDYEEISEEKGGFEHGGGGEMNADPWSYPNLPPFSGVSIPNYYYMKATSTKPTTVYQEAHPGFSISANVSYEYGYNYPMYGYPANIAMPPVQDQAFFQNHMMPSPQKEAKGISPPSPLPPPPPPPPGASSWDFFNPFQSYEQSFPGYEQGAYRVPSATSSPNSSEVREREGIPELEEETELESLKEPVKARLVVEGFAEGGTVAIKDPKEAVEARRAEMDVVESENESQGSIEASKARGCAKVEEVDVKMRRVSFEQGASMATNDRGLSKENALAAQGTRDIAEVVKEIKEQFNSASSCGEEVSRILEVGRMRYRARNKILRLILLRILDMTLLWLTPSRSSPKSSQHSTASALKMNRAAHASYEEVNGIKQNSLSSILDRLYLWEEKLYKEVKEEEKLKIMYDREWKHLKALYDSGAEAYKLDSARSSVRHLLMRINMVIRSVKVISYRIHKIREDELQPHLIDLIQGLMRMWRVVLDCHHKQFQAVVESKAQCLLPKYLISGRKNSSSGATVELERELLNWCYCFSNWVRTQKAYIESLNGWLLKWLPQEQEETPDGVAPFSPGRIGAPSVFIAANDWFHTTGRISEAGVIEAMRTFAISVHQLSERQDEEQHQKLKAEYLSKDFAKRLESLQKVLENNERPSDDDDCTMTLDALKRRMDKEMTRHDETVKLVQEAGVGNLRAGLIPIFEALESFTSETLKGYEGVRVLNGTGVT